MVLYYEACQGPDVGIPSATLPEVGAKGPVSQNSTWVVACQDSGHQVGPVPVVREAAGIEGLILFVIVWSVLSLIQRAGQAGKRTGPRAGEPASGTGATTPSRSEGTALERILRQIEEVQRRQQAGRTAMTPTRKAAPSPAAKPVSRQAPPARRTTPASRPPVIQDERGPLGRKSSRSLEAAPEVEDRTSLEEQGVRTPQVRVQRPPPVDRPVDQDEGAEALVERRILEAEQRNRPLSAADHRRFREQVVGEAAQAAQAAVATAQDTRTKQLRDAIVWREILGPPRSLAELE